MFFTIENAEGKKMQNKLKKKKLQHENSLICLTYKFNQWWNTKPFRREQIESVLSTKAVAPWDPIL